MSEFKERANTGLHIRVDSAWSEIGLGATVLARSQGCCLFLLRLSAAYAALLTDFLSHSPLFSA